MNEKRRLLLFMALKNGGTITSARANRLYSGNKGKDALISLYAQGYFEKPNFGTFKLNDDMLTQLPAEVVDRYKEWKKSKDEEENDRSSDSVDSGSKWVTEPVS